MASGPISRKSGAILRDLSDDCDVVALQEVMRPDEPALLAPGFTATVSAARGAIPTASIMRC